MIAQDRETAAIALYHLVWGPLGVEMVKGFVRSYCEVDPGVQHSLTVIFNGVPTHAQQEFSAALSDLPHDQIILEQSLLDLEAYRRCVETTTADICCFMNSFSRPRVDRWLLRLVDPLAEAQDIPTITGAMGSWQSLRFERRRLWWPEADGLLRRVSLATTMLGTSLMSVVRYPSYPNPHLRTNAFAARTSTLRRLDWPPSHVKEDALRLESSRSGFSRQILSTGGRLLVVDGSGVTYPPAEWRDSRTFRLHDQSGLIVSDNRSDEFHEASPAQASYLGARAWAP